MWVIAEQENGQLMNVTFELLGAAKELCAKLEEKCCAVLVTAAAGELPQQLIAAGADVVYVVEDAKYADYDTELYTDAICQLSKWVPFVLKYSNRLNWITPAPVRLLPSLRKQAL